jgi:hypothetical protein
LPCSGCHLGLQSPHGIIQWLFIYILGSLKFLVPETKNIPLLSHRFLYLNFVLQWQPSWILNWHKKKHTSVRAQSKEHSIQICCQKVLRFHIKIFFKYVSHRVHSMLWGLGDNNKRYLIPCHIVNLL